MGDCHYYVWCVLSTIATQIVESRYVVVTRKNESLRQMSPRQKFLFMLKISAITMVGEFIFAMVALRPNYPDSKWYEYVPFILAFWPLFPLYFYGTGAIGKLARIAVDNIRGLIRRD